MPVGSLHGFIIQFDQILVEKMFRGLVEDEGRFLVEPSQVGGRVDAL